MSTSLQRLERGGTLANRTDNDPMAEWQMMREQAGMLIKTGFLPSSIKTAEQAVAIIMTGRELGIGTMVALNNINVIQGKPTVPPQLMLALINRTKDLEVFDVTDDGQACTVTMKRRGRKPHSETFSMKDAALLKTTEGYGEAKKTISLSEKYNWKQQPGTMRKWRAVAACARIVFPDVILGLYTPDEMGAIMKDDGEPDWMDASPPESLPPQIEAVPSIDAEIVAEPVPTTAEKPQPPTVAQSRVGKQIMTLKEALKMDDATFLALVEEKFDLHANTPAEAADGITVDEQPELVDMLKARFPKAAK